MSNREIKFRGLTKDGKWKYGFFGFNPIEGQFYIHEVEDVPPTQQDPCGSVYSERYDVEPATIGQFTGIKDINGIGIYEGDIVKWSGKIYVIKWLEHIAGFIMQRIDFDLERPDMDFETEIIGNIYQNPELLTKP